MRRKCTRSIGGALVSLAATTLFVVVTAVPASAQAVSTADQFRAAFDSGTAIELQNDITLCGADDSGSGPAIRTSSADLDIDGGPSHFTIHQGCPQSAILLIQPPHGGAGTMTVQNLTASGGTAGGILSKGSVVLENSTLTNNTGGFSIQTALIPGAVQLFQSSITGGTSAIEAAGSVLLSQSTINNNHLQASPGGIQAAVESIATINLVNSTVTNNSAPDGAIYGVNSVILTFSTVVENQLTGHCASRIFGEPSEATVCGQGFEGANVNTGSGAELDSRSSVIAMPSSGANCAIDGPTSSGGYNWTDDDSCGLGGGPGDVEDDQGSPGLAALADNGGPTLTRLPTTGSPLIDRIPSNQSPCAVQVGDAKFGLAPSQLVDQRAVTRPQGPACDIGAVEVVPGNPNELPTVTVTAGPDTAVEGGMSGKFTFTRQGDTSFDMGVAYNVSGTATSGSDYTALAPVVIPAGQSSASIDVDALTDNVADPHETVIVQITMGPDYAIGSPSNATVTILEDFCQGAPQADYPDRESFDVHAHAIDCITAYAMAMGFDDGTYGATLPVSRAQMASMIARMLNDGGVTLPSNPPDAYPGDDGDVHELAVNQLAALGVLDDTTGQSGDSFNVSDPMRRDDMAQLLYNTYKLIIGEPLADGPDAFTDDNASDNEQAINALANAGVVEGAGGGMYDPSGPVSRGQMASFFVRLMQLLVDAGQFPSTPPA